MRISDWSSDVCSSDLRRGRTVGLRLLHLAAPRLIDGKEQQERREYAGRACNEKRGPPAMMFGQISARSRTHDCAQIGTDAEQPACESTYASTKHTHQHRLDERRGGKEGGSTCRTRWS